MRFRLLLFTMFTRNFGLGTRLRSTHCREFNYLKLCRPAHFVRTTQSVLNLYTLYTVANKFNYINSILTHDLPLFKFLFKLFHMISSRIRYGLDQVGPCCLHLLLQPQLCCWQHWIPGWWWCCWCCVSSVFLSNLFLLFTKAE